MESLGVYSRIMMQLLNKLYYILLLQWTKTEKEINLEKMNSRNTKWSS